MPREIKVKKTEGSYSPVPDPTPLVVLAIAFVLCVLMMKYGTR